MRDHDCNVRLSYTACDNRRLLIIVICAVGSFSTIPVNCVLGSFTMLRSSVQFSIWIFFCLRLPKLNLSSLPSSVLLFPFFCLLSILLLSSLYYFFSFPVFFPSSTCRLPSRVWCVVSSFAILHRSLSRYLHAYASYLDACGSTDTHRSDWALTVLDRHRNLGDTNVGELVKPWLYYGRCGLFLSHCISPEVDCQFVKCYEEV